MSCIREILNNYVIQSIVRDIDCYMGLNGAKCIKWVNFSKAYHRNDSPAYILYDGDYRIETWFRHGRPTQRRSRPNKILYYKDIVIGERWINNHKERWMAPKSVEFLYTGKHSDFMDEWYINGQSHRMDGPAHIKYHRNGNVSVKAWFVEGVNCNFDDCPAVISYYNNGNFRIKIWVKNGKACNTNSPCITQYHENGNVKQHIWGHHGKFFRADQSKPDSEWFTENGKLELQIWHHKKKNSINGIHSIFYRKDGTADICGLKNNIPYKKILTDMSHIHSLEYS